MVTDRFSLISMRKILGTRPGSFGNPRFAGFENRRFACLINRRRRGAGVRGFTLVEIMTAVALLSLLAYMVFYLFKGQAGGYKFSTASQELQESVRRLHNYLGSDIKMTHTFDKIDKQSLILNVFNASPDLADLSDPAKVARTSKIEYAYDPGARTLTRTIGGKVTEFEKIDPDLEFAALTFDTAAGRLASFDFDPAIGNHTVIGIRMSVKASTGNLVAGRSPDFKVVSKFFSRNRTGNFYYGPVTDGTGVPTGRTPDPANPFNRDLGYFSSVDADPGY